MTLETVKDKIKYYRDFPREGIVFIDLLPLLGDAEVFSFLVEKISSLITCRNVAAPEARGFLFSAPLLMVPGHVKSLIVFRKTGKLPYDEGDLVKIPIVKEYGDDSLYFRKSDLLAARPVSASDTAVEITVFDDVLATGGTAEGMARELGMLTVPTPQGDLPVKVKEFVFLGEIVSIGARSRLEKIAPVKSILTF